MTATVDVQDHAAHVVGGFGANIGDYAPSASDEWMGLERDIVAMRDVLRLDRPTAFTVFKDRSIPLSAPAWADALLVFCR